jgi:hypothetical protein
MAGPESGRPAIQGVIRMKKALLCRSGLVKQRIDNGRRFMNPLPFPLKLSIREFQSHGKGGGDWFSPVGRSQKLITGALD